MGPTTQIVVFSAAGLLCILVGIALGTWYSRRSLGTALAEIQEKERRLRKRKVELERLRYQESTARIHRTPTDQDGVSEDIRDQLEQKNLELSIREQELGLERTMLQDEIDGLRKELAAVKGSPVSFVEMPRSESTELEVSEDAPDSYVEVDEQQEDAESGVESVAESVVFEIVEIEPESDIHTEAEPVVCSEEEEDPEDTENAIETTDEPASDPSQSDSEIWENDKPDPSSSPSETVHFGIPDFLRSYTDEEVGEMADQVEPDERIETTEPDIESMDEGDFQFHWTDALIPPVESPVGDEDESAPDNLEHFQVEAKGDVQEDVQPEASALLKTSSLPQFQQLSDLVLHAEPESILDSSKLREITGLPAEKFNLLEDLGYADIKRLSSLSKSEIRRLADIFRIEKESIENDWIPGAAALLD